MKKKLAPVVVTALMAASLMTACGGASETPTTSSAPAVEAEPETVAETEPEAEVEEETEESAPVEEAEPEDEAELSDESESEDFTLLDVSEDMIDAGVYAVSDDETELVFSMFTAPDGTPMASLILLTADGAGDVICGTYTSETETDEEGIDWTLLVVSDVYTGNDFSLGFGESDDEVYIFDTEDGTPYEGQYLSASETIDYMGVAVALMEQ